MSETGERMRALRDRMRMSQRDVEAATGLSQATLCRIERGEREATAAELVLIADSVGASVSELTGTSCVGEETTCAARAVGNKVDAMYVELLHYLEVSDYLDRQGFGANA